MVTVALTSLSLLRLGLKKRRFSYVVIGALSFVVTVVSAYLVSTLPLLGEAAGFTLSNQTTSYVTIVLIFVGSAIWYWGVRWFHLGRHGVDISMAFKELPLDGRDRGRVTEPLDASVSPRFAQVATFGRLPLQRDLGNAAAVFLGIPWDDATSYRSGAREGPSAIRTASRLVRPYNMFADVYPFRVLDLVDYGDIDPVPGYTEDTFQRIQGGLEPLFRASVVPFVAGGDHSITLPILRAYRAARSEGVSLLHFDAHFDTWESYWGTKRYTHGTWVKRAYEEGLIRKGGVFQVGIRSSLYSREDVTANGAVVDRTFTTEDVDSEGYKPLMDRILRSVADSPVYVSVDIDVLDPAYA